MHLDEKIKTAVLDYVDKYQPCFPGSTMRALVKKNGFNEQSVAWVIMRLVDPHCDGYALRMDGEGRLIQLAQKKPISDCRKYTDYEGLIGRIETLEKNVDILMGRQDAQYD